MCAGMRQILPLEIDLRAAQVGRQPPRMGQRGGPADISAQQIAQLGLECGVGSQGKSTQSSSSASAGINVSGTNWPP